MGEQSGISYVHHSVGFWRGCRKIRIGCDNCFGDRDMRRYGHNSHQVVRAAPATFNAPFRW